MKKILRKIIREQLQYLVEGMDGGILDDTMTNLETQIGDNIKNLETIKKATDQDIENKIQDVKAKKQLKGQLPAQNSDRQGLERQIPAKEKEIKAQQKQVDDIEKARLDFEKAQKELNAQQLKIAQGGSADKNKDSTLNSLESPI